MADETEHFMSLGLPDPSDSFDAWSDEGYAVIKQKSDDSRKETGKRLKRTFSQVEACKLIGRSESFLKGKGLNDEVSPSNLPRYTLKRINELRDQTGTRYKRPSNVEPLVLAMAKLKGGVGNSTICVHLAHYFALHGLKVLIADFDLQCSASTIASGMNPDEAYEVEETIYSVLRDDPTRMKNIIKLTYFENVHLAPCNSLMQSLEFELAEQMSKPDAEWPQDENGEPISVYDRALIALDSVKAHYDVILIDCPPALGTITLNALTAADGMINTIRPSPLDRTSFATFNASLASMYEAIPNSLRYYRILINQMVRSRAAEKEDAIVRHIYGNYVVRNNIVDSSEIQGAPEDMSTLYDRMKPVKSVQAYKRALESMDLVFGEIFQDLKTLWAMEAEAYDNG
ncbi:AAA family ATPase [Marinobacter salarius]|uniref:Sporulation initiation inhibitor protein Soj n=1 Tax=Marinobacter salarius TaxID=1420917 RepID=A0A1W6KFZ6_9GAMM|nr:AAA family ATPase [Marinobacter salarius]ARM86333.1 sporulation initiation inhibitor protein Soj [Marinobacter salarius]